MNMKMKKSSTTKIGEDSHCGYSMSTIWGFDHIEDKHTLYCPKDCMKMFCESLRQHTQKIIDFEKNVMVDKKRIRITQICRKMLSLWNKIL